MQLTIRWEDDDDNLNDLMLAQSLSVQDWDNEDDEVWNDFQLST